MGSSTSVIDLLESLSPNTSNGAVNGPTASWQCARCTLANNAGSRRCLACGTPSPVSSDVVIASSRTSMQPSCRKFVCDRCTLENDVTAPVCSACGSKNPLTSSNDVVKSDSHKAAAIDLSKEQRPSTSDTLASMDDLRKIDEANAFEARDRILMFCRENKSSFVDDSFPPYNKSLGLDNGMQILGADGRLLDINTLNSYVWLRPSELRTRSGRKFRWSVFREPKPDDIVQGMLGDCWLMSALAVLAERPDLLQRVVVTSDFVHEGVYLLRLCVDGAWKVILVDDFFPAVPDGRMAFSEGRKNQLWVPLIEKAVAKAFGSYGALAAGRCIEGLALLTGAPCKSISLESHIDGGGDGNTSITNENERYDLNWATILSAKEANYLMGCSCGAGRRRLPEHEFEVAGLQSLHAYSILDVREVSGGIRLLKLHNPWGQTSWNGEWSDRWPHWPAELRTALMPRGPTPGVFWMPYERFVYYFDAVDICMASANQWELRVAGTLPNSGDSKRQHFYALDVNEACDITLSLHQSGFRASRNGGGTSELDLCIVVVKASVWATDTVGEFVCASERRVAGMSSVSHVFQPGSYMVFAVAFNHWTVDWGGRGSDPPCILAAHAAGDRASRAFTVQRKRAAFGSLADAIIQYVITNYDSKKSSSMGVVSLYTISTRFAGLCIVLENALEDLAIDVTVDCSDSVNVVATRGALRTADTVPPLHRQILACLSHLEPSQAYTIAHRVQYGTQRTGRGRSNSRQHKPHIGPDIASLHVPRPMFKL